MPGIKIVRRLRSRGHNPWEEVTLVNNPADIDVLKRAFAKDRRVLKELQLVREFASAQMVRGRTESTRTTAKRDQIIVDLRTALGPDLFQRVADKIDRMVKKAKEGDPVVP